MSLGPLSFKEKEREAFKEAQEQGFSDIEWQPPRPISTETIQMFRSMEETNAGLWAGLRGKAAAQQLKKAAKINKLKRNHRGEYKDTEKLIFNGHPKLLSDDEI